MTEEYKKGLIKALEIVENVAKFGIDKAIKSIQDEINKNPKPSSVP